MVTTAASNLDLISQTTNPSKAETDKQKLFADYTQFLNMLMTQLQNQDPTEPLDVNQFTQQLVMFASVEQQVSTNQNMEKLVDLYEAQGVGNAVSYIGKLVEAEGNGGFLTNGVAPFVYSLEAPAEKVNVLITDASGRAVFSGQGTGNSGKNLVTWDGTNSFTGQKMPEGTYYLQVLATGYDGSEVANTTYSTGYVSAVELGEDDVMLTVGNQLIPLAKIIAIRETPQGLEEETASTQSQTQDTEE